MFLNSIRARMVGSYLVLLILLIMQIPIIYVLVGNMSGKYSQVDAAGALRKRAVEINAILYKHIIGGEKDLDETFQKKKAEYGALLEGLKNGAAGAPAVKGNDASKKLEAVAEKWNSMRAVLDSAMERGNSLNVAIGELEKVTPRIVDELNGVVRAFARLDNPAYRRSIDIAGLQRMRAVKMGQLMERYVRSGGGEKNAVARELEQLMADFEETLKVLKSGSAGLSILEVKDRGVQERLNEVDETWRKMRGLLTASVESRESFHGKIRELADVHTQQVVSAADALTKQIAHDARRDGIRAILILVTAIFISVILVVLSMWLNNRHIIMPICRLKEIVEEFADGNLTKRAGLNIRLLGRDIKDEITGLGNSIDRMASQMSQVISMIKDSSNRLAAASEELSASSAQIAQGVDKQSGDTAHVATAMEEMSATVVEIAKNSHRATESAIDARTIAANGGEVVSRATTAMQEVAESTSITADTIKKLGKSSEEIGTIVSVINDIAEQTNLLALNAAIEAARAGEQGRGFAVVADEVRNLAERTAKATKEINAMITSIQEETSRAVNAMDEGTLKVENGVRLANEAGTALKQIVSGVESVSDMISHIATSAEEQSATTEEMTQNMESVAGVAKTNVVAIGEVARATDELASLSIHLQEVVDKFRIDGEAGSPTHKTADQTREYRKGLRLISNPRQKHKAGNSD